MGPSRTSDVRGEACVGGGAAGPFPSCLGGGAVASWAPRARPLQMDTEDAHGQELISKFGSQTGEFEFADMHITRKWTCNTVCPLLPWPSTHRPRAPPPHIPTPDVGPERIVSVCPRSLNPPPV